MAKKEKIKYRDLTDTEWKTFKARVRKGMIAFNKKYPTMDDRCELIREIGAVFHGRLPMPTKKRLKDYLQVMQLLMCKDVVDSAEAKEI